MAYHRNIFIVNAYQVDSSGTYSKSSGFPKTFDSESYNHDIDKALKRATGAFATAWAGFCNVDNFQTQTVTLDDISGFRLDQKTVGVIAPVPEPEPEPEPETQPEPEPEET